MSLQHPSDRLAHCRTDVQLLFEQISTHQEHLEFLVTSTEQDLQQAETAASESTTASVDQLKFLFRRDLQRRAGCVASARRLCSSGRGQYAAASRLLEYFDDEAATAVRRTSAVLVVDDYGEARDLVALVLRNAGFIVRTAANGLEGLIAAHEMRPDVIVTDVAMPVLDGIEATRLIKAGHATRHARVIAYTANASLDHTVAQRLFAAVLQKPATPAAVVATVQHVASL